jgi:zinc protease
MKTHKILHLSLTLFIMFPLGVFAQKGPKDTFEKQPLHEFKIPEIKRVVLKNGMKFYMIEDHRYPTIDIRGMVFSGTVFDSAEKAGLAAITGTALRSGGTEKMRPDQLDRELEQMGASVEVEIDLDNANISSSMLSENSDRVISIFADILRNPVFDKEMIDLVKKRSRTMISRRNDSTNQIVSREFQKLIFGSDSPFTRQPEYSSIESITRDDINAFYKKYFVPGNMIFAVWGDFNTDDLAKKFDREFGSWSSAKSEQMNFPKVSYDYKKTLNYIEKGDANQSNIMIGHIGGLFIDPDYPALAVMNRILSFDRMFKRIRTDEGLAYSVYGNFGAGYLIPGIFTLGAQTKSETTVRAIDLMIEEMTRMTKEEVSDAELSKAKDQMLNSFIFDFDTRGKIARRMLFYAYYGYPLNFSEQIIKKIENVTKADILNVAKKRLKPEALQILVVGKKQDFDASLSKFGTVKEINISIPEPKK